MTAPGELVAAAGYLAAAQLVGGPMQRRAARQSDQAATTACQVCGWQGGAGRPCVIAALAVQTSAAWLLSNNQRRRQ